MQSGPAIPELILLLLIGSALIVGVIFIFRGIRGVPVLSDPRCTRCGYDLRWIKPDVNVVCPECGSDLTVRRAIRFAEYQRRPRSILVGLGLIVAVFVVPVGLRLVLMRSRVGPMTPASRASLPSSTLIANLATTASQPWDWQELERRLNAGQLSKRDTAVAIDQLIKHMQTKPSGWREPLHWCDRFVAAADKAGFISDEQLVRLGQAFYGAQPDVKARSRLRQGQPFTFELSYGTGWSLPGLKLVMALSRTRLEGAGELGVSDPFRDDRKPADPDDLSGGGPWSMIRGKVVSDISAGKHNLVFEVDTGLIDEFRPFKTDNSMKPGQAERWPKTRCRWNTTVTVPVEIVAPDRPAVDLVIDEKLNPMALGQLSATARLFARSETKSTLELTIHGQGLPISIASVVVVKLAGQEVWRGSFCVGPTGRFDYGGLGGEIARPAPHVTTLDVILTPSVELAEKATLYDRIWGQEILLENVPLQREDLEEGESALTS
ncbi:MAG TPA: zinc ribbon domain-containing protein [Phycisphaerae bacterium]|nr:zinc ribbon domain-containing protein [Phycisphaerae bacterium]